MADIADVPAVEPKRTRRSLGWIAVAMLLAIALIPVGLVCWMVEGFAAISEWNRLGGSINVENTTVMMFGREPHASLDEIAASLRRLQRMPGCEGLSLQGDFSPSDIDCMAEAFQPVELGVSDTSLNDECLRRMAEITRLRRLKLQGELNVTADGLRQLLAARPDILIFVERSSYHQTDLDALQRDFPNRVTLWD